MTHWKLCAAVIAAFSVLALAGCSHSQDAAGGGAGPNDMDKAAQSNAQKNSSSQAAAAQAAAHASSAGGAPKTAPK